MARFALTEQPNGDFVIHFPEGSRRLRARRQAANALPAIAVEGERTPSADGTRLEMFQVRHVTYRREDGKEITGTYLGKWMTLLPVEETRR